MNHRSMYVLAAIGGLSMISSLAWAYMLGGQTSTSDKSAEAYLAAVEEVHRLVELKVQGKATEAEVETAKADLAGLEASMNSSNWFSTLMRRGLFWGGAIVVIGVFIRERIQT